MEGRVDKTKKLIELIDSEFNGDYKAAIEVLASHEARLNQDSAPFDVFDEEGEKSMNISQLTGLDKFHLPALYDAILDNPHIATPKQIATLLKAMGRPLDKNHDKRELKRRLEAYLAFSRDRKVNSSGESQKTAIIKFFKQLEPAPANRTETAFKNLYNNSARNTLANAHEKYQFENLYKKVNRLLNEKNIIP